MFFIKDNFLEHKMRRRNRYCFLNVVVDIFNFKKPKYWQLQKTKKFELKKLKLDGYTMSYKPL